MELTDKIKWMERERDEWIGVAKISRGIIRDCCERLTSIEGKMPNEDVRLIEKAVQDYNYAIGREDGMDEAMRILTEKCS